MGNQKVCDLCSEIIKGKIYYLAVTETEVPDNKNKLIEFITLEQAFSMMAKKQEELHKNTKYYEICEGCKKVLDYLLVMRKDHLQVLKQEAEGILKLPPYEKEGDS